MRATNTKCKDNGVIGDVKMSGTTDWARYPVKLLNVEVQTHHKVVVDDDDELSSYHQETRKEITRNAMICALMTIVFLASSSFAVVMVMQRYQHKEALGFVDDTSFTTESENTSELSLLELPGGHYIFSKSDWRGAEALVKRPLLHPTPIVVISNTNTPKCLNFDVCSARMRSIQNYHMGRAKKFVDIGYNFLIGGDGNVYEGRGWDTASFHRNPAGVLGISFIGDYREKDFLTDGQTEAAQQLIVFGVNMGKLSPSYALIGHNQTFNTDSPGENIVKIIQKWANWSPDLIIM
ncbi:peptidoglycan-recognition protein SC2-like [Periplaneta americana]|uniref:peptidoglycan-recognition protein SC2-like n=1 Tax=Periplaneta americana TaxID=6978 RepID=UPI0037E76213